MFCGDRFSHKFIPFQIEKLPSILSVGRSECSDLRHANRNEIISVEGRSDLRKKVYYIVEMVLLRKNSIISHNITKKQLL